LWNAQTSMTSSFAWLSFVTLMHGSVSVDAGGVEEQRAEIVSAGPESG
jgi:hypothetical protein